MYENKTNYEQPCAASLTNQYYKEKQTQKNICVHFSLNLPNSNPSQSSNRTKHLFKFLTQCSSKTKITNYKSYNNLFTASNNNRADKNQQFNGSKE